MDLIGEIEFDGETRVVATSAGGSPLTIHRPRGESRGSVCIIPGWSGPRSGPADILTRMGSQLAIQGWTATRLDLPGRGDSQSSFDACDLDSMIAATAEVVRAGKCTALLGLCSGANVALGTATLLASEMPGLRVIALSILPFQPARSSQFDWQRRMRNIKQYAKKAASPNTWGRLLKGEIDVGRVRKNVTTTEKPAAGERNLKDSARDIERELLAWKGRALFVWGGGDEEAPPARAHYEKLRANGMASAQAAFHTIPNANHNFYGKAWREELLLKTVEFLAGG